MSKRTINSEIYRELKYMTTLTPKTAHERLCAFLEGVKPDSRRTNQQNRGLHKDCDLIAEKLNDSGLDMKKVLKPEVNIPWTTKSVKEYIFKPIMKALFNKDSTKELKKNTGEIEKIHEVIMRELGEKHGIEYHEFPHNKQNTKAYLDSLEEIDYPEYKEPKF